MWKTARAVASALAVACGAPPAMAQQAAPQPSQSEALRMREGDYVIRDFAFHDGARLPELKLHYRTLGDPKGEPVVILHGTTQSGAAALTPEFGGRLFGPGQPLDVARYYVILPDAIGHGASSKPSDGLRARFPNYNYDDMVAAQHRLVTDHLGVRHARLVLGVSMGGMQAWLWGVKYPDFMDILAPMSSQPTAMSARNWMMRRLIVDSIRNDPDWKGGDYVAQPGSARFASVFYAIATNGGTLNYQALAPTRAAADKLVDQRLNAPFPADANDTLYQWASSGDYDPSAQLEKIAARVLAINSADDERNPPETGLMEQSLKRMRDARLFLIPASARTRGHGTVSLADFWKDELARELANAPRH